jgi:hypothetical protein
VVYDLMSEIACQSIVGLQRIAVHFGAFFNVLADHLLKRLLAPGFHYAGTDFAVTFQDRRNNCLAFRPAPGDLLLALRLVHVAGLAPDKGFVHFHFAGQLVTERAFVQGKA